MSIPARHTLAFARRPRVAVRTLPLALIELAATVLVLGAAQLALLYSGAEAPPHWVTALFAVVGWTYAAAGLLAWWRRPANRIGALMVAGGGTWIVAGFVNTSVPALVAAGLIVHTVPLAILVHLLHAFPSGRLSGGMSRATVVAAYVVALALQAPQYLFTDAESGLLRIADRPDLAEALHWLQVAAGAAVFGVTAAVLIWRLRDLAPGARRRIGPLFVYGTLVVVLAPLAADIGKLVALDPAAVVAAQLAILAVVPVAFAFAVVRGGFARTAEIEQLSAWLGADGGGRRGLLEALTDALGDPSVELLFWVPEAGGYVDAGGRGAALPAAGSARAAVEVAIAGRRVGAIVYDARLLADPQVARDAGRIVALALDRERLTAELQASRAGLRRSRARIVEAADHERRRIARDLHDGLQTRLVLLAIAAGQAGTAANGDARAAARELQAGLRTAIEELRELVQGVMPTALTQGGLYTAAEELADRAPVPTTLTLDPAPQALPAAVESTGYFVLSEALANAVKHSRARELRISLRQSGACLRIEIADDGIGGAVTGAGSGLRGIADRVEAHDGRLVIDSPPGAGTRILVEVPCAS